MDAAVDPASAQYGQLNTLYLALRAGAPQVKAKCIRTPDALGVRPEGDPEAVLVVTYQDQGPLRVAWDRNAGYVWPDTDRELGADVGDAARGIVQILGADDSGPGDDHCG